MAADGSLRFPFTVPDDLGGAHPIRLLADGRELASAAFVVETSLVSVTPATVRRGESFEIQLKGVGWTEYDNILNVTYDNAVAGYVCGFTSQGDVLLRLTAAARPASTSSTSTPASSKDQRTCPSSSIACRSLPTATTTPAPARGDPDIDPGDRRLIGAPTNERIRATGRRPAICASW